MNINVGDLVKCTIHLDRNNCPAVGLVIGDGAGVRRVHFTDPEKGRANPRWVSIEYLEVINENR